MSLEPNPAVAAESPVEAAPSARFLELIAGELAATEELLAERLGSDVPFIRDASSYIFAGGGKRVRPALLLLCARLLDRPNDQQVTYASVVELIHTATLVHDDIIDQADLRRGRAPVNAIWGNSRTVLLGDWLYTTSMAMALEHGSLEVVRELCSAVLAMTEGELLTLERLGAIDLTVDEYFEIIDRKTARLFAAACTIPALSPVLRPGAAASLGRYGRALGTCFQLVDDLLDFTATASDLGKPALSDLKGGQLTLPLILLLPRVDANARRDIAHVIEDRAFRRVGPERILELVRAEGTVEEASRLAADYASRARDALTGFPPCEAREALEFAPEFVLHRRS